MIHIKWVAGKVVRYIAYMADLEVCEVIPVGLQPAMQFIASSATTTTQNILVFPLFAGTGYFGHVKSLELERHINVSSQSTKG